MEQWAKESPFGVAQRFIWVGYRYDKYMFLYLSDENHLIYV